MELSDAMVGLQALADPEAVGAGQRMREGFHALFEMLGGELSEVSELHYEMGRVRADALQAEAVEKRDGLHVVE